MTTAFILRFAEEPKDTTFDDSIVEYSEELNLNVLKNTLMPAIRHSLLGTETFTKTQGEGSDPDRHDEVEFLTDTFTETRIVTEDSDSDANNFYLQKIIDTATLTEVKVESTDVDPT